MGGGGDGVISEVLNPQFVCEFLINGPLPDIRASPLNYHPLPSSSDYSGGNSSNGHRNSCSKTQNVLYLLHVGVRKALRKKKKKFDKHRFYFAKKCNGNAATDGVL